MKPEHAVAVVAVISILLVIGFYQGAFSPWLVPPTVTTYMPTTTPTTTPITGGIPVGTFTVLDVAYNTLDISTALTLGTDVDQNFWGFRNGGWVLLGAHGSSGTNIELTQTDGGYIYVLMKPHTTHTEIADAAKVLAMNSRAVSSQFADPDGDNVKEFVIKWSMFNVPPAASGYPSTTFTGYYFTEISASASIPSGGQPADATAQTTANTVKYLGWYMTLGTTKTALAVFKIQIKVNTTNSGKGELQSLYVPTKGLLSPSSADYSTSDTSQYWTFTFGSTLGDCIYWPLSANTNDKFELTAGIKYTFVTTDVVDWTITIYELNYAQSVVMDTDTCELIFN